LFIGVENGIDTFDCVSPTRIARNGSLYTQNGRINILNANYKNDFSKILSGKYEIDTTSEVNSTNKEYIALAEHQMGLTLGSYNIYLSKGFTANNSFNLPVISCSNATQYTPVIYFRHGNSTSISVQDNCVIAEASSNTEFIRVKDRLLYGILGVMG